ncbi:ligand-binding SRPBCC domain-containing protein [Chryseobacterium defluvii]|uniref:Ligand-binding SRPBCC domain-containing protein n=1 Tax=Chryseobacterium defluvii TaxID=160396 RepID=A0A840KAM5_9FLAO|nr:SRPBCC family protein [Chryseobacterium defluvii]MBB4804874.1 ligand-binding SRPBCC domain-containing protein [Chryseobacterium defluvii]
MAKIYLQTAIKADIHTVFDLARDIDLHQQSTSKTKEKAIAGRTSGLIENNETVTWRAKHLGIYQTHTSKIMDMEKPYRFTDIMLEGTFKSLRHQHIFEEKDGNTIMTDIFEFESPYGVLGRFFNSVFLTAYLRNFLLERNAAIKEAAERNQ